MGVNIHNPRDDNTRCGVWRFCTAGDDVFLEQCTGCGEYREHSVEDIDL